MESLLQLLSEWEIQLLVLLSFMLQVFLFFTGDFRRCTINRLVRVFMWLAYLGADMVAVYTLGLISRHVDVTSATHQLAFLWAPFLLIHLGGQDTVTAFAIEDNNLWLRHLLNLTVQVSLVLYILWKSSDGLNMWLLVPSIFVSIAGIIKYGERSWALWCGNLTALTEYTYVSPKRINKRAPYPIDMDALYPELVYKAIHSVQGVRDVFVQLGGYRVVVFHTEKQGGRTHPKLAHKLMEIELGLMYDDIYTKAQVLRARGGIILRCISQISFLVASVLFFASNKQRYNSVDTAITYALFIGGFCLEVCAVFITMMSPWTWAWLEDRECHRLSGFLLSINIWWQRRRPLWSKSMGQYNLLNYLGLHNQQSGLWKRSVMAVIRKVVNTVCGEKQKFWMSKMFDTEFVEADEEIMRCVIERVHQYNLDRLSSLPKLVLLEPLVRLFFSRGLKFGIVRLHVYTEVQLSRYSPAGGDGESLLRCCRTLSNYMLYILATHPQMLPITASEITLISYLEEITGWGKSGGGEDVTLENAIRVLEEEMKINEEEEMKINEEEEMKINEGDPQREINQAEPSPDCTQVQLLSEIKEAWIRLLIYAAGKSRPEVHAAQLARGGELLTFVWLHMAHHHLGDSVGSKVEIGDLFTIEQGAVASPSESV